MDFTFSEVNITGGFWKNMQEKNRLVTMRAVYDRFDETGRMAAMACQWDGDESKKPHIYWDSDVAKWMEGAAYVLQKHPDAELEAKVEHLIDGIEKNQWEDGYYNSYYMTMEPQARFTVRGNHELYCAGHLIEAAVAYYEATGKARFLRLMEKYVDLIYRIFVEERSAAFTTPGHEELELALIRLYRVTKKKKYLELCGFFLDKRGTEEDIGKVNYNQSLLPVRMLKRAEGHAVRACYLYAGMADYAYDTGDEAMLAACHRLFDDIVNGKLYITGGIGSTRIGEAFTVPYDLPNSLAYTETCAAISLMFFAQRLLEREHRSVYADVIERIMYNGMISGLSLSGKAFFYENPLEISLIDRVKHTSGYNGKNGTESQVSIAKRFAVTQRQEVFSCSCCPPNINRVFASMERYFYHEADGVLYVDQFADSTYEANGMHVIQQTAYPVKGEVALHFEGVKRAAVRLPAWCERFTLSVPYTVVNGYAMIENPTDVLLTLSIEPVLYEAHQEVRDCAGRVAVMRGPVVYCAERVDNPVNLHRLCVSSELLPEVEENEEYGLPTVTLNGFLQSTSSSLYQRAENAYTPTRIRMIPFYAFANRGESDMLVWLRYR